MAWCKRSKHKCKANEQPCAIFAGEFKLEWNLTSSFVCLFFVCKTTFSHQNTFGSSLNHLHNFARLRKSKQIPFFFLRSNLHFIVKRVPCSNCFDTEIYISRFISKVLIAELPRAERARGTAWLRKFGNLSIREILVLTSAYACAPVRADSGGGGGESQGNPIRGGECHLLISWGEIAPCFWATSVFLGGKSLEHK